MQRAFSPFHDSRTAAETLLDHLHDRYGLELWMVTRTDGNAWVVRQSEQTTYAVGSKELFGWTDSLCARMIQGQGPSIVPDMNDAAAFIDADQELDVGAYIGIPLTRPDGMLFGTLCGIDPRSQPATLVTELPQLNMFGRMLSTIVATELRADAESRRAHQAEGEAETDSLTNLFNRRGWDRILATEEARCQRYGHTASIITVDVDEFKVVNDTLGHTAGDIALTQVAQSLGRASRATDTVARTGGDEFAVLAVECDQHQAEQFVIRFKDILSQFNLRASVGTATRTSTTPLDKVWIEADLDMYEKKHRLRKQKQVTPPAKNHSSKNQSVKNRPVKNQSSKTPIPNLSAPHVGPNAGPRAGHSPGSPRR